MSNVDDINLLWPLFEKYCCFESSSIKSSRSLGGFNSKTRHIFSGSSSEYNFYSNDRLASNQNEDTLDHEFTGNLNQVNQDSRNQSKDETTSLLIPKFRKASKSVGGLDELPPNKSKLPGKLPFDIFIQIVIDAVTKLISLSTHTKSPSFSQIM